VQRHGRHYGSAAGRRDTAALLGAGFAAGLSFPLVLGAVMVVVPGVAARTGPPDSGPPTLRRSIFALLTPSGQMLSSGEQSKYATV